MRTTVKKIVRFFFKHGRMRIQSGPCRGLLWSIATRSQFLRGTYEPKFTRFISEILHPDDVFWDVGAHMGYYTMLASKIVQTGHCYAMEPSNENQWYLKHHRLWNKALNVTTFSLALSDADGVSQFGSTYGTGSGRLGGGRSEVVVRTMDSLIEKSECRAPTVVKMDVEGAEMAVLKGANELLNRRMTTFLIATHGNAVHKNCAELLVAHGFSVCESMEKSIIIASPKELPKSEAMLAIFE